MKRPREEILHNLAREMPANKRRAFLDQECEGDAVLRARVEALLVGPAPSEGVGADDLTVALTGSALAEATGTLTEAAGTRVGRYKLLAKIGEGGFGSVWAAEQREPVRRRVALKIIKLGMDTKQVVARFEAERQALALMDHPNIAKVLDGGATDTGRPYFVMELVKGTPITTFCTQEKLDTKTRLELFIRVCQAVQHAHQKGIIHRDIKPPNILVTQHDGVPVPKVIDFGIAKAMQQELTELTIYTQHQQFLGTPAYMSPEQAEMSGLDIDTRSDIYSLGVLLYELLVGSTPFDTGELLRPGLDEMRRIIREREPVRPSTRLNQLLTSSDGPSRHVPQRLPLAADLDWIVMKCLEKDRTRRYETANGLAADLQRHLDNEPVVARPPSAAYRFQKAWRRNKLTFAASAAVGLALTLGGLVSAMQAMRATQAERRAKGDAVRAQTAEMKATRLAAAESAARERASRSAIEAQLNLYAADMKLAQLALAEHNLGRAVTLLDRHRPEPGEPDIRGFEWRYLWQRARGQELASLRLGNGATWDLAFSPDARWLAAAGPLGLRVVNMATPREQFQPTGATNAVVMVAFLPDGQALLTAGTQDVQLWDTVTWQVTATLTGAAGQAGISPGGDTLMADSPAGLQILDAPSFTLLHQLPGVSVRTQWSGMGRNLAFSRDGRVVACLIEDESAPTVSPVSLRIWNLADLRTMGSSAPVRIIRHPEVDAVMALALSEDGSHVAASTTLGFLAVWDTVTGDLLASRRDASHSPTVRLLRDPHHDTWIGASNDQTLRSWRVAGTNLVEVGVLLGHLAGLSALAASPDGELVATGDSTGVVKLWDPSMLHDGASKAAVVDDLPGQLTHLQFLSDNRTLTAWAGDLNAGTLTFWDTLTGRPLRAFSNVVWHAAAHVSPDERSIALARASGPVEITSIATGSAQVTLPGMTHAVRRIFFTPDSRHLLTGSPIQTAERGEVFAGDAAVRRWDAASGQLMQTTNLSATLSGMAMAPDGVHLAVHMVDGAIEVRRTADFSLVFRAEIPAIGGPAAAYSPDGRLLAVSCVVNNQVRVWDTHTHQLRFNLQGHGQIVHAVAFSPDGLTLASAGHDRTIRLWSTTSGQELLSLRQAGGVFEIAFSSDGRILAAGTYLGTGTNNFFNTHLIRAPSFSEIAAIDEQDRAATP